MSGAYGHINHIHEDYDLTFSDLFQIIKKSLSGNLMCVEEKTDGINLLFTWRNNEIRFARNKTHLKFSGYNAFTTEQIKQEFVNRGILEFVISHAVDDINSAISKLSDNIKETIFKNGKKFISMEIIYPDTVNIIPYGFSKLVLQQCNEYDPEGNIITASKLEPMALEKQIQLINEQNQSFFNISYLKEVKLKPLPNYFKLYSEYSEKLKDIMKEFNLTVSNTIHEYLEIKYKKYFTERLETKHQFAINLIVRRYLDNDKSVNMQMLKSIIEQKDRDWLKNNFEPFMQLRVSKEMRKPIENIFLELGVTLLSNIADFMIIDKDKGTKTIQDRLMYSIKEIRRKSNLYDRKKLVYEVNRLRSIGKLKDIVPTEGITFMYGDKMYKMTGMFAPINQIIGMITFAKK